MAWRVTEQGDEMIRFKYGLPEITVSSLSLYTGDSGSQPCCHHLEPKESWRRIMDELSVISCDPAVVPHVKTKILCLTSRSATPEQELGWENCRWVHVRRNVAQPAASSHYAPFRGSSPGRKTV